MSDKQLNKSSNKSNYQSIDKINDGEFRTNALFSRKKVGYTRLPSREDEEDGPGDEGECVDIDDAETTSRTLFGYPIQVFFILGNELCERFSYYGIAAILMIYLKRTFEMTDGNAMILIHGFLMICFVLPILGGILADNYLGKYKTIYYLSMVYVVGDLVLSITAIPAVANSLKLAGPVVGLLLVAIGTGGIKPCVAVFGGDQFEAGQERKLVKFFSLFYLMINFGSVFSMILTPILRGNVTCFGRDCYFLAFGVPAVLMIISFIIFIMGSSMYKKFSPEGNVMVNVCCAVASAVKNRFMAYGTGLEKQHWIEWASDNYSAELKTDIRGLFKVLFMFLPMPVYWALFTQQGTSWTLQATQMDGDIGILEIKPDQMQAINAAFIMILIPSFEVVFYPIAKKCGIFTRSLQRMGTGMVLNGLAFAMAGIVQTQINHYETAINLPGIGYANYRIVNAYPCDIHLYSQSLKKQNLTIPSRQGTEYFHVPLSFNKLNIAPKCLPNMAYDMKINVSEQKSYTLVVGQFNNSHMSIQLHDDVTPPGNGQAKVRFIYAGGAVTGQVKVKLIKFVNLKLFEKSRYISVDAKSYSVKIIANNSIKPLVKEEVTFASGKIYTFVLQPDGDSRQMLMSQYVDRLPRKVSILWQIPQYFVITLGEVMFSITGYEFAYSQAPASMKSCIMASSLLTIAFGNLLVTIIEGFIKARDMRYQLFLYAVLQAAAAVVFIIMAWFYKYVNYETDKNDKMQNQNGYKGSEKNGEILSKPNKECDEKTYLYSDG